MEIRSYRTSFAQQRLYFLQQLEPWNSAYNMTETFRLRGDLRLGALASALSLVADRHEMLRSRFLAVNGVPEQIILSDPCSSLPRMIDFTAYPLDAAKRRASSRIRTAASTPFNLHRGPLFYAELIRLSADEGLLSLYMHHIISDGWSVKVICDELSEIYQALVAGRTVTLADLPVDYVDFAAWEETMTSSAAIAPREDYWLRQLTGAPVVLAMPADGDTADIVSERYGAIYFTVSERLVAALTRLAKNLGVTPFVILFTAFQTALASWTGQRDFLVGVPAAARGRLELQNVVGLFVNMLAIRSSVWGDPTFEELVQRVGAASDDAFENQDFPFQRLVELINPPREPHTNPLVQVSFQLIDDSMECRLELPGVDASREYVQIDQTPFDLEVDVTARDGLLDCMLHYCGARLHAKSVAQLGRLFETVIADALTDPLRRVSELGSSSGSPAKAPR